MSNVAKLKKQAAEFEAKKQFDKALAIYIKLLDSFDENASELDVGLFNRVGDLLLRQGNVADAVDYLERAVDLYESTGFFNNAIALCNKILRHSPGRTSIYYKLGRTSAKKGFNTDAKVNFLEYADRMQKAGKVDEAFRALKEFADLCPDQDEIRLMLAEQLTRANRRGEAIEQLQLLHERYDSEGRASEATATAARIRAIDPTVEPRVSGTSGRKATSSDLIFLDLDDDPPSSSESYSRHATPAPEPLAPRPAVRASEPVSPQPDDIPLINTDVVVGTPASIPVVDESLDSLNADDSLGVVKSTPTSSVLSADSFDDEAPTASPVASTPPMPVSAAPAPVVSPVVEELPPLPQLAAPTPAASVERIPGFLTPIASAGVVEDIPVAPPVEKPVEAKPAQAIDEVPAFEPRPPVVTPERIGVVEPLLPDTGANVWGEPELTGATTDMPATEFTIPTTPVAPVDAPSIDFDLSSLVSSTPASPATPPRHTRPGPANVLDGLPLMDFMPPAVRQSAATPAVPGASDLELIIDPALGMTSGVDDAPELDESIIDLNEESITVGDEDESEQVPTPSVARRSTMVAAHSVEVLRASVELDPDDWSLRRQLAEAMLEAGHRAEGIAELELAMNGAERFGDLDLASSLAEEIARLEPEEVRHHQKRVEYAFRTNDRTRLIEAYVALADSLFASDQVDKARTVYQRVLDLAPDDIRARAAIDTLSANDEVRQTPAVPAAAHRSGVQAADLRRLATDPGDGFVNLGDWLRDEAAPRRDTRMVVAEQEPTGDEEADFADMLRKFKQGVAENVDPEDFQSHYDLAIAYKEMGLIDEAIAEFQKALGGPNNRLPTYEALGQCFIEKAQYKLASSILSRALNERAPEEHLVGVLYLLGRAAQAQGLVADAVAYYQRVFVVDIQFRDIADRLSELERVTR